MPLNYYELFFILSFILSIIYVFVWEKHYDVNITAIFILIPVHNLGYVIYNQLLPDIKAIYAVTSLLYINACFLTFFITMCILNICNIEIRKSVRFVCFIVSAAFFISVLTVGRSDIFYKGVLVNETGQGYNVIKEYGFMHTVLYAIIILYFVIGIIAIIKGVKDPQVSNKLIMLLFIPEVASIAGYAVNRFFTIKVEPMPLVEILSQIVFLLIVHKMSMLNIGETAVDAMIRTGDTALISIDNNMNYLSSNETARKLFPELLTAQVDSQVKKIGELGKMIEAWVTDLDKNKKDKNIIKFENGPSTDSDDEFYAVSVRYLSHGEKKLGYQIYLTDDTEGQKYVQLVENYNKRLEDEVEEKTRHIVEMHDKLILGMATMVESRDNSTGGHIKRTSTGVKLLVNQMKELPESFKSRIIKAAPMHDIGKVTVDDSILRKPGRITDEEFEKMKAHTSEGARIINEILQDTDDDIFKVIAENVAHFHHEKWDGSGYPKDLKGEEIPLEARIMAIADVYDALVSKRSYKEGYSFEKVNEIIMEGMGTQFDPALKEVYEKARPEIEKYYKKIREQEAKEKSN